MDLEDFPRNLDDVELIERANQIMPGDQAYWMISDCELGTGEVVVSSNKLILSYELSDRVLGGVETPIESALVVRTEEDGERRFFAGKKMYEIIRKQIRIRQMFETIVDDVREREREISKKSQKHYVPDYLLN